MKKLLALAAVGAAFALAACGGGANKLQEAYDWVVANHADAAECFEFAADGSFVGVDTNPTDRDDYSVPSSFDAVEQFNAQLGLPDYIWEEMLHTSSNDGRQTQTANGITVSWKYHPDNGLEATYRLAEE